MDLKFIHLLYVPTMNCNMKCSYCYLEENTLDLKQDDKYLKTLKYAVEKFKKENVIPFNISLHGGEVTTLSKKDFRDITEYISKYYIKNKKLLVENGFKVGNVHIKTNLLNLKKHIDAIKEFNISISGSLDLPLTLHNKFRLTKGGGPTLEKILENIKLLENIPNKKKVSSTIFNEHFEKLDEIIEDLKFLEKNTCLNMNDFNFMIGFKTPGGILSPLSEENQVKMYNRLNKEFKNTSLEEGFKKAWFAEFTPNYCINSYNCGEKFFLLERNGDIYSCVRGQKNENFYYGNIYIKTVKEILENARLKIFKIHNDLGLNKECENCKYLYICKTGCPYVKKLYNSNKSYTCRLQKEIYKNSKDEEGKLIYPEDENFEINQYIYLNKVHPQIERKVPEEKMDMPTLKEIIEKDEFLKRVYNSENFLLKVDNKEYMLESQILKDEREIIYISDKSDIKLYIKKDILDDAKYPLNNSLYVILLSGNMIKYGDEGRRKQEHIMTHQIYKSTLEKQTEKLIKNTKKEDKVKENINGKINENNKYYILDLKEILKPYLNYLDKENPNNIFFTTNAYRDYHYTKQKNNGYYHIQAINLPFQNIEFIYLKEGE